MLRISVNPFARHTCVFSLKMINVILLTPKPISKIAIYLAKRVEGHKKIQKIF